MSDSYRTRCAEWCYAHGYSFTPLAGKRPTNQCWQSAPRESLSELVAWCDSGNIGLRTGSASGGIVVVDEDRAKGGDVSGLNLPATVTVETGGGGRHYYFRCNRPIRNSAGKLGPHIDVRGEGGQVVFPGSVHPETGAVYEFSVPPWEVEVAELPAEIIERLETKHRQESDDARRRIIEYRQAGDRGNRFASFIMRSELHGVASAPEGARNDTLNRAAYSLGRLVGGGYFSRDEVRSQLMLAGSAAGLDPRECEATVESGLNAGTQEPRTLPVGPKRVRRTLPDGSVEEIDTPEIPSGKSLDYQGNADRFEYAYGEDVLWCEQNGKWYVWTGDCWRQDDVRHVELLADRVMRGLREEARSIREAAESGKPLPPAIDEEYVEAIQKWASRCNKTKAAVRDMLDTVRTRRATAQEAFNQDAWLLAAQNGMVDLRTGVLMPHDRKRLVTMVCNTCYDPGAECPTWLRFLHEIMGGLDTPDSVYADEMVGALQRLCGYFLTGDISVQILPIFYGSGANGKSVFIDTVAGILGPYAGRAPESLIVSNKGGEQHPTEIADLLGKRLVVASETDEGQRMRVARVKAMTGDSTLKGRYMRQDFFEFRRTHKLVLVTNHKPNVYDTSHAIWRRLKIFPFQITIPPERQDRRLLHRLRQEWPGILSWMVEGCRDWVAADGDLGLPDAVEFATTEYQAESDQVGRFLEECCIAGGGRKVPKTDLYALWGYWCDANGEHRLRGKTFNARMRERGHADAWCQEPGKSYRTKAWDGLEINAETSAEYLQ